MSAIENIVVVGNGTWRVGILPEVGASLTFGQIADDDGWVDLLRPTPPEDRVNVNLCSSYPLIPWSNRIQNGVLRYEGRSWQLRKNDGELVNAIHGAAREFGWEIVDRDASTCTLAFDSASVVGVNFPWSFRCELTYEVRGDDLRIITALTNTGSERFPAGLGHHPYFQRRLAGASDEVRVEIPCSAAFRLHRNLAGGPPVALEPRIDFRAMRALGSEFIDDCLTARDADAPIRLFYPRSKREIRISADPILSSVVLYVPQHGTDYFAVEPVSNANNGFSLYERGIPGSGIFELAPDETQVATITITVTA
jgi:aldose 1-epimerase